VVGEGFDVPSSAPALQPPSPRRLVPDYAPGPVGGTGFHSATPGSPNGLDGIRWPSGRSSASITYVSPRGDRATKPENELVLPAPRRTRIRKAVGLLFGK
jgi:hypothetical protein